MHMSSETTYASTGIGIVHLEPPDIPFIIKGVFIIYVRGAGKLGRGKLLSVRKGGLVILVPRLSSSFPDPPPHVNN